MCRIWENKKSADITPEQLRKGLRNALFSEVAAVGLNGGEPTLRDDLGELTSVLFDELPALKTIALITNAYNWDEVIARIEDVGRIVQSRGGFLDVMVSLDGAGEVHDRVRGKPGNFERAQKVIAFAKCSPLVGKLRIGCTIIKENVYGLADLLEYCLSEGIYVKYRLGIPHQRLYTLNLVEPYALSVEEKYHVAEFLEGLNAHYETDARQRFFYRSLIDQLVRQAPRRAGCDWQHRGATITAKGELLYCAVKSDVLGVIDLDDSEQVYFGHQAHLRDIITNHCDQCHHDYVGIPPRSQYALELATQAARRIGAEEPLRRLYQRVVGSPFLRRLQFDKRLSRMESLSHQSTPWNAATGTKKVLICGWYGTETLGDKAILAAIVQTLRKALGATDITLVSLYPYVSEVTRLQMPELNGIRIVDREAGVRLASGADLLVFGGGPLMAIDELADMQAIFSAARRGGARTLVAGCGVGPLGAEWHNNAIRDILNLADARIYRDERTRQLAAELGVASRADAVAEDPAFTWLQGLQIMPQQTGQTGEPVLLLGLRDFPYGEYARHLSERECLEAKSRYEETVLAALETLKQRVPSLIIRPLPMCTNHYGNDDRWFYRRLLRGNARLAGCLDLSLLGRELRPAEYAQAFGDSTAVLAMRFHSLVFALGLGIPAVAIDYTLGRGKVHELAQHYQIPCQALDELSREFLVDDLTPALTGARNASRPMVSPRFAALLEESLSALFANRQNEPVV